MVVETLVDQLFSVFVDGANDKDRRIQCSRVALVVCDAGSAILANPASTADDAQTVVAMHRAYQRNRDARGIRF